MLRDEQNNEPGKKKLYSETCPFCMQKTLGFSVDDVRIINEKWHISIQEPEKKCTNCGKIVVPSETKPRIDLSSEDSVKEYLLWFESHAKSDEASTATNVWQACAGYLSLREPKSAFKLLLERALDIAEHYLIQPAIPRPESTENSEHHIRGFDLDRLIENRGRMLLWKLHDQAVRQKDLIKELRKAIDTDDISCLTCEEDISDFLSAFLPQSDIVPGDLLRAIVLCSLNYGLADLYDRNYYHSEMYVDALDEGFSYPQVIIADCIYSTAWTLSRRDDAVDFATAHVRLLEKWANTGFISYREKEMALAASIGFSPDVFSLDHVVSCILDTLLSWFSYSESQYEVTSERETRFATLYESIELLRKLTANRINGPVPQQLRTFHETAALLHELANTSDDISMELSFRKFEQGREPEQLLKDYLHLLMPHNEQEMPWYSKLLEPCDKEKVRLYGRSFNILGYGIEKPVRMRASALAKEILGSNLDGISSLHGVVRIALPELFRQAFDSHIAALKELGHGALGDFNSFCLDAGITQDELAAARVGIEIKRMERRLRSIIHMWLHNRWKDTERGEWFRRDEFRKLVERVNERCKQDFENVGKFPGKFPCDSYDYIKYLTFGELRRIITANEEYKADFPDIADTVELKKNHFEVSMDIIGTTRNKWAHDKLDADTIKEFYSYKQKFEEAIERYESELRRRIDQSSKRKREPR